MTREEMLKDLWKEVLKLRRSWQGAPISDEIFYEDWRSVKKRIYAFSLDTWHITMSNKVIHLLKNQYGCVEHSNRGDIIKMIPESRKDFYRKPCLCYQEISPGQWVKREHLPYQFDHEEALARIEGEG